MSLHNFGTVMQFEFIRTVTKRRFWIMTMIVPVFLGVIFALQSASTKSSDENSKATLSFTYYDGSGLVSPKLAKQFGGTPEIDVHAAETAVKEGRQEAFFKIPATLGSTPVTIYANDRGIISNNRYSGIAESLVRAAATAHITDPRIATVVAAGVPTISTIYRDGAIAPGIASVVAPSLFVALFCLSIMMLGQQMLSVTLEEKENRVSEMILTAMNPTTLILGKLVALVGVSITQMGVIGIPIFLAKMLTPGALKLPAGIRWSDIPLNPGRLVIGFLLFLFGFLMFAGLLVAIGAVMPTAREASGAFSTILITMFLPFYGLMAIVSAPHGLLSNVFTFFPLTAPITCMLRNAFGTLPWWEIAIVLAELAILAILLIRLGVLLFRTGSISYDSKVNIWEALQGSS